MTKFLLPFVAVALTAGSAAAQRPIVPGEVTRGTLSSGAPRTQDGSYYDAWTFAGRRGETVIVTMESRSFDTYLYLGTARRGSYQEIARDDDGGNGTNSRMEVRLPEDGTYLIRASSLRQATGPYTLTLDGGRAAHVGLGGRAVEPGIHVHQRLEVGRVGERRVAQAVDADDLRCHALPHLRLVARVGEDHQPRVAVQVDEPRSDHAPRGIEDDVPAQVGADRRDAGPVDRKVQRRVEALAGIDHASAADHHREVDHAPGLRRARRRARAAWANGRHAREQKAPPIQCRETDERAVLTSQVL
jgi:hypothetical protein